MIIFYNFSLLFIYTLYYYKNLLKNKYTQKAFMYDLLMNKIL